MKIPRVLLPALLALTMVTGCKTGPDYHRPPVSTPAAWQGDDAGHATTGNLANLDWWEFYHDPVLTNLLTTALAQSKDLQVAAARIEQALSGYRIQRSYQLPSVDAAASWTRGRSGYTGGTHDQFEIMGFLSYEIDIWGRLRRATESARAQLLASEEGQKAVLTMLIANVASTYFNLRSLDEQLAIARRTHISRTNSLNFVRIKYDDGQGIVSQLDVRQAETQVYTARATIAELERAVAVTENALSVLLGNNPGPIVRGPPPSAEPLHLEIPAGLPSDLLLRRPDIAQAEQLLVAANAEIGVARAAYFPRISLTAALGLQSLELGDLFDAGASHAWSFAPQVAAPIFNAGRTRAGVQAAEAMRKEALAVYEQSIQNAFREVEDSLVSIAKYRDQLAAEEGNAAAEKDRLALSTYRYQEGIESYSDVLDAERFLFNAELRVVQTRTALLIEHARLYKALGGGWTP